MACYQIAKTCSASVSRIFLFLWRLPLGNTWICGHISILKIQLRTKINLFCVCVTVTFVLAEFVHIRNISAITDPILTKLLNPFFFVGFHFFGHKMLQTHNFLDLKFSGSKFLLNSEFLWTQNHFLTQNYFDPKNVTPKEGFVQNTF